MAADKPTEAALAADRYRILVVDDAADAREVIQTQLEDQGYRVVACSSVEEALALLAATPFDVIITDLRMPRASGLELVRHVRGNLADAEIMMVTGYPTIEGAVEAVKTGAEHYLAKPFTEQELVEAVAAIITKLARRRLAHDTPAADGAHGIIGASEPMQRVFRLIDRGLFREDLYYRINVIDIPLPPLRERGDDLLLLVNHFRTRYGRDLGRPAPSFSDETLRRLAAYHWPGNVRELENLVQRLVLLAEGERIEPADLPATLRPALDLPRRLDRSLAEHEADYIRAVLASVGNNKTRAAAILGIDRKTLREKLGRQG